jgi:hypothetical protein
MLFVFSYVLCRLLMLGPSTTVLVFVVRPAQNSRGLVIFPDLVGSVDLLLQRNQSSTHHCVKAHTQLQHSSCSGALCMNSIHNNVAAKPTFRAGLRKRGFCRNRCAF